MAALLAVALGAVSASAGIAIAVIGFAPIPYADSIDFLDRFFAAGGWDGYGLSELYARHNEHRILVPRLWFLADLALFRGTQASLIVVTVLSSLLHGLVLVWLFRSLGHRGWMLGIFAAAAVGGVLSPAQWENLVWSFQVQFIQVWLFASLAFLAVSRAEGRHAWWPIVAAVLAGLASTYSMANGLIVWPLLVGLALWCGVRGGPLWLLAAASLAVLGVEAAGYHAHPGHGDPVQTIAQPLHLLRYAFRYLANAVGMIGTSGQEAIGAAATVVVVATAIDALRRPARYRPEHAVLLAIAGFVIAAALLTALGRVTFGLGQANAGRYATPSFIFLLTVLALLLDRFRQVERRTLRAGGALVGVVVLLVPGLVSGIRDRPMVVERRDAHVGAVVAYLAGGFRPASLAPLFPFTPRRPFQVLEALDARGLGPFASRDRFMPPPEVLAELPPGGGARCRGNVDRAENREGGLRVEGWAAAADSPEQPEWVVLLDRERKVVGWGSSRTRRDDVGEAIEIGWRGRGFQAVGRNRASGPLTVVGVFADGGVCSLGGPTALVER